MSILVSLLLVVEVVAAFLLVVVILAQKSKDQGLGMAFGSGMGESLFGSRAGNVLTRMTIILSAVFMATTMLLAIMFAHGRGSSRSVMDRADLEMPVAPVAPASTAPAAAPQMPAMPMSSDSTAVAPLAEPSAPVALQMGGDGTLEPVVAEADDVGAIEDAPAAAEETLPAAADSAEEQPAQAP